MPTPHISAQVGEIAKTVLMPGDPLRSRFIAETYLKDPVLVNDVRGVQGYTGTWKGVPVTVMASGMGIPSIGIYSWELFNLYGVDNIIRIGSAGALSLDLKLLDIVAAMGTSTDSNFAHQFDLNGTYAPTADYTLLSGAVEAAKELGYKKIAIAGGVAANSRIRADFKAAAEKAGCELFVPPLKLCGDNAAMIGAQGYFEYLAGNTAGSDLNAYANMEL